MRWDHISEEKKALMVERRKRGESFSRIGRDLGVDRRVVAKIVRENEDKRSRRAAIRPGALTELFHEHREDMETVATGLLQLTLSPLLRGSLLPRDPKIKEALHVPNAEAPTLVRLFKRPPLPPSVRETEAEKAERELCQAVELRLAQRRLDAAFHGLLEHVPGLEAQIAKWEEAAVGYKEVWSQLQQHATSLGVPPGLIEPSVRLALERIPALGEEESLPRFRGQGAVTNKTEHFAKILLQTPATRQCLKVFWQNLSRLDATYRELEEILSPPGLDSALVTGHCKYCPVP